MKRITKHFEGLPLKARASVKAVTRVFTDIRYVLAAIAGLFLSSSLVIWSLNLDLARYIISELPISAWDKFQLLFWDQLYSIFTTYDNIQAVAILIFSVLFGINFALIVYVLKNQGLKEIPKKSSFGGTVFAVLAGGCVACGTSLLAPLAATLGATSSAFLRDASVYLNWFASLLTLYSIYRLGLLAATVQAKNKLAVDRPDDLADAED